jgi:hypothetical protein
MLKHIPTEGHMTICKDVLKHNIKNQKQGVVVHFCNPSTQDAKAGGFKVQGQPRLHSKSLSQKTQ